MDIDLGFADAGVGVAVVVLSDYLRELHRTGQLPSSVTLSREVGGEPVDVTVLVDPPTLTLARQPDLHPRLDLTGTIEVRPAGQPQADPITLPLLAAARLAIELVDQPGAVPNVGLRYDGADGTPSAPVTAADLDDLFASPQVADALKVTIPLAAPLVKGLNESRFPDPATRPDDQDWSVALTLLPGGDDSVDSFAVTAAPPGTAAEPVSTTSFIAENMGLSVAYNRLLLDLGLAIGAAKQKEKKVDGATLTEFTMRMLDDAVHLEGHLVKPVDTPIIDVLPDVDVDFEGPAYPSLIRGTTAMTFDTSHVTVDVDDSDEVFYFVLKWMLTIGAAALLFTGSGIAALAGIAMWSSLVQFAWNGAGELDDAPHVIRDSIAASLGAQLSALADALDQDTDVGQIRIDATPDSMRVIDGHIVLWAQVFVVPLDARLKSAEFSHKLKRFGIFELEDGRRFRAQELARLMKAGKVTVPGFHEVNGDFIQADHDNQAANNLLQMFRSNETHETVVRNHVRN